MRQIKHLLIYVMTLALLIGGAAWAVSMLAVPADGAATVREETTQRALPPKIAAWRERQAEPVRAVPESKPMREVSAARVTSVPRPIIRDLSPPVRVTSVRRARPASQSARQQVAAETQTASVQPVVNLRVETLRDRSNN